MDDIVTQRIQALIDKGGDNATALAVLLMDYSGFKAQAEAMTPLLRAAEAERDRLRVAVEAYVAVVEGAAEDPRRIVEEGKIRAFQERSARLKTAYGMLRSALDIGDGEGGDNE